MDTLIRIFLILVLSVLRINAQTNISFYSGDSSNSEIKNHWELAGSDKFRNERYPEYIFNAITDIGLSNDSLSDCSILLQDFLNNKIINIWGEFYGTQILVYFPPGKYRFDSSIDFVNADNIILKGDLYYTNFYFTNDSNCIYIGNSSNIGLEDIYIQRVNYNGYNGESYTILFYQAIGCWLSGVKSIKTWCAHSRIEQSSYITILGCYFESSWVFGGGGQGYGVSLVDGTHHCLVENNIFSGLRHAILFQGDSKFNVIGYNAIYQNGYTLTDIEFHGKVGTAYGPSYNLIEGNSFELAQFSLSDNHGENGPFNTFLRNKSEVIDGNGMDLPHNDCSTSDQWGQNFILSNPNSHWANVWVCDHILNWQEDMDDLVNLHGKIEDHSDHTNYVHSYYLNAEPSFMPSGNWPYYRSGTINGAEYRNNNSLYQQNEMWNNYYCQPFFPQYKIFLNTEYVTYWDTIQAGKKIVAEDYLVLTQWADVNFIAGEEIELLPGFTVGTGATFKGFIGGCGTPAQRNADLASNSNPTIKESEITIPLAIENVERKIDINLAPNPVNDYLSLYSNLADWEWFSHAEMYNLSGSQFPVAISTVNKNKLELNVMDYPNGVYILKIIGNNGEIIVKKWIKYN